VSALESTDGICGIPSLHSTSERRLVCKFPMGHHGDHDWTDQEAVISIFAGITRAECVERAMAGRSGAVAARAMLGMPDGCICRPLFEDGNVVDYIFEAACPAHVKMTPK
jgi:hypothetical protein